MAAAAAAAVVEVACNSPASYLDDGICSLQPRKNRKSLRYEAIVNNLGARRGRQRNANSLGSLDNRLENLSTNNNAENRTSSNRRGR